MTQPGLERACDRLSQGVDSTLYQRLCWSRIDGPMLVRLVELAQAALEPREDFDLSEEGSATGAKRFVLKVHNNRIMALAISLGGGQAHLNAEPIDRGRYLIAPGPAISADYAEVSAEWMDTALSELFSRVTV